MKPKYPIKNPVTATNICLMLLPLVFILLEILKLSSEDIKFGADFSFVLLVSIILIIPSLIFEIFNIDIDIVLNPIEFIFDHKYTSIIIFSLLFILGVISFVLYSKNKIKAYKKLAVPISAIWLSVILIHFFILSVFVFAYIDTEILAFLATVVCFAIFLPIYIIAVITVDKTASLKISEQPKEEENETTS